MVLPRCIPAPCADAPAQCLQRHSLGHINRLGDGFIPHNVCSLQATMMQFSYYRDPLYIRTPRIETDRCRQGA